MSMAARIARIEKAVRPPAQTRVPWAPRLAFNDEQQVAAFDELRDAGLTPADITGVVCIRMMPLKPLEGRHVE